mgnify:CR=1 FL=1
MNRRKFIYSSSLASLSVMGLNSCNIRNKDVKITILHTNDVHSQIEPFPFNHDKYPDRGGFARRANIFKGLLKINPNTLIFDAGDIFQGTPYFNFFQGDLELKLMKKMGYNAATIGNHEFDAGLNRLKKNILNNMKFKMNTKFITPSMVTPRKRSRSDVNNSLKYIIQNINIPETKCILYDSPVPKLKLKNGVSTVINIRTNPEKYNSSPEKLFDSGTSYTKGTCDNKDFSINYNAYPLLKF